MKAVILAGGIGTRLRPVTYEIPKPLITVKKKPIVNYLIDLFVRHGIQDIGLLIHKDHIDEYDWWKIRYGKYLEGIRVNIFIEPVASGTFGGLRHVLSQMEMR